MFRKKALVGVVEQLDCIVVVVGIGPGFLLDIIQVEPRRCCRRRPCLARCGFVWVTTVGRNDIGCRVPVSRMVEGQERRLTGTAQAQYDGWRRLLREIYQAETGFTKSVDVGVPARATENTVN